MQEDELCGISWPGYGSAGRALALGTWLVALPARTKDVTSLLPLAVQVALWDLCKEVLVLGVFCP